MGGYAFLRNANPMVYSAIMAFASGAILAMLCDTMIPEAFKYGGRTVALVTVLDFSGIYIKQNASNRTKSTS